MRRAILFMLVCCSVRVAAQQDPKVFGSVGGGFSIHSNERWKLDLNASLWGGYRLSPSVTTIAYLDYNGYSFAGYYEGSLYYTAHRRTLSVLVGAKISMRIPEKPISPYFLGALGLSNTTSSRDSIFGYTGGGSLLVFKVNSGNTPSFLTALGADVSISRRFSLFLEIRTSFGLDSDLYDILWLYRAGIGIVIY